MLCSSVQEKAMADDPDSLVLVMLRDIRATLDKQGQDVKALRSDMSTWTETIAHAAGFAVHANLRGNALEGRVESLEARVTRIEEDA
jgi:hypothetical protein